ncbi:MAG: AAA family ATPase [Oligoflexia bacterium]|nr:AAA family ATPase [Oligoflexia bacterium]
MKAILGHERQREALTRLAQSGKLAPTLLFCGMPGIGKSLVARELAQRLLCRKSSGALCGECEGCRLVASNSHPDFYYFDDANSESGDVDGIRKLLHSLTLRPYYSGNRVVILDNSEALNPQSVNVLLKSLEEPRPSTYFILITTNRTLLLPTLVSRCQAYYFDTLSEKDVRTLLQSQGLTGPLDELVAAASGSLAHIEDLKNSFPARQALMAKLERIVAGNMLEACSLAQELSKDKDSLAQKLQLLRLLAHQGMLGNSDPVTKRRWAEAYEIISSQDYALFERNLNPLALLTTNFCAIATPLGRSPQTDSHQLF